MTHHPTTSTASVNVECVTEKSDGSLNEEKLLESVLVLLLRLVYHKPAFPHGSCSTLDKDLKAVVGMATDQWEKLLEVWSSVA